MSYWQLFYHLVWTTKDRQPLLTSDLEPLVHNLLFTKAVGLGAVVYAVNGIEDHVHMVVSVPPKIALATFIGQVKGAVSARINQGSEAEGRLYWQAEYGVFSFDSKRLPNYIAYVCNQKAHHHGGAVIPILERTAPATPGLSCEPGELYAVEDPVWRAELAAWEEAPRSLVHT